MAKLLSIGMLTSIMSCDTCLHPDCALSTNFRFNLVDSVNRYLIYDSLPGYSIDDIQILDNEGNEYPIKKEASLKTLRTILDGHHNVYTLRIKIQGVDTFNASFRKTKEKCCGRTFWIDQIAFRTLDTKPSHYGSTVISIN